MLSDQFKQASQKISQSIGFHIAEDGSLVQSTDEKVNEHVKDTAESHEPRSAPKASAESVNF